MSAMANPGIVREPNGTWTVVSEGRQIVSGCTLADAVAIEAVELAFLTPCEFCDVTDERYCPECGWEVIPGEPRSLAEALALAQ